MRGMKKAGISILLILTMLLVCMLSSVSTFALTVPDISRIGSISITMTDPAKKEAVPGGNLILYKVGEVHVDDANYSWVLSSDFAGSGADLSDLESEELTAKLADYAAKESITPIHTAEIDENGKAVVKDLPVALYLIIQTESALGYKAVMPFLVTIPMGNNEDGWVYDVDASPKVELEAGTPTPTPTETPTPTPSATPPVTVTPKTTITPKISVTPKTTITPRSTITPRTVTGRATITPRTGVTTTVKSTLPRTGQLWWPVPILAVVGIVFVFVGLRRRSR